MKTYLDFIKEGFELNKLYVEKIYNLFESNGYGQYKINLSNEKLPLLNLFVTFEKNNKEKYSYFDNNDCKINDDFGNKLLEDCKLYFSNFKIEELKSEIGHEINHIQEYYNKLLKSYVEVKQNKKINNIHDKINNNEIRFKKSIHDIINSSLRDIRNKNKDFDIFLDIIYNTTDNELNSKIPEIYYYLKSFKSEDISILRTKLQNYSTYRRLKEIDNINFKKLSYGMINKINRDELCDLINIFNKIYIQKLNKENISNIDTYVFLNDKIFNIEDIINYFLNWEKLIKNKFNKWYNKVDNIIKKVIIDLKNNENNIIEEYDFNMERLHRVVKQGDRLQKLNRLNEKI